MPDGSTTASRRSVVVSEFTNSVLDPAAPMLGPLENGGTIIANTAPGCWGPMITPRLRGGHEVTTPVFVNGAEPRSLDPAMLTTQAEGRLADALFEGLTRRDALLESDEPLAVEAGEVDATQGKADPKIVNRLLAQKLS